MEIFFLRQFVLWTIFDLSLGQWSSDGTTQTFKFATTQLSNYSTISWIYQNGNRNLTLFVCGDKNVMRCDPIEETILDFYSANITSNSSSFISVFTIKNVSLSLHNTRWFCDAQANNNVHFPQTARFDLNVFAPAQRPLCDKVKLLNVTNIQINCWTKRCFPGNMCLFKVKTNNSAEYDLQQGDISYTQEQNLTTLYYQTTCTLVVSAAILGPGSHMFHVVMYPNITSNIKEEMKTTSENSSSIYLGYPRALLGTDCEVQSYVKENKRSNCTCFDNNTSILPTQIYWLSNKSIFLEIETLSFEAKRRESFQCIISNHLNWTDTIDFRPKISYPPDNISVNISKQVFDLCNDTYIVIFGACFVGESYPEPSITVNINNYSMDITALKNERQYVFKKTMASAGIYNIFCLANSKEYSKIVSNITTVSIKGPSGSPIIFKAENKENKSQPTNLLKITKGDTITCQSKGGYPMLKNISLKCGPDETSATNQDNVSMTLNISNVISGTCECIVWQESTCLQNTSTVQFQFVFPENSPVTEHDFNMIYLGVGVAAGCFVVIITLVFTVSNLHEVHLKKSSSDKADNLVNNEDVYFITEEKSDIDLSIYPEYTNVVTTMSSAMEAPKNLNK